MKKSINERIHDLRERSGLTQSDLAIQLGMTRSGVNAWEMGISKPSLENLVIQAESCIQPQIIYLEIIMKKQL